MTYNGSLLDHEDLEAMFHQYTEHRFQWHFSYWLFKQPPPFNRQLHAIFLQWRKHNKRKVSKWAAPTCDVEYLASLHPITADYWKGRLALGDEAAGELGCLGDGAHKHVLQSLSLVACMVYAILP